MEVNKNILENCSRKYEIVISVSTQRLAQWPRVSKTDTETA